LTVPIEEPTDAAGIATGGTDIHPLQGARNMPMQCC